MRRRIVNTDKGYVVEEQHSDEIGAFAHVPFWKPYTNISKLDSIDFYFVDAVVYLYSLEEARQCIKNLEDQDEAINKRNKILKEYNSYTPTETIYF